MQYGHFDDANREYVIERPDTPLPWINYLGCEAYFGIISNTAGGYSFYRDARLRRLTRYRYNNVPFDIGGRYIYVRDNKSSEFWSPSWQPTRTKLDDYSCRHGMGYSVIGSKYKGIEARTRYFVPLDENLEIWQFTVTNHRQTPATLSTFSRSSSACGTRRTMLRTSSATFQQRRWKSKTALFITRRSIASAAITLRISPARQRLTASIRSGRHSWGIITDGTIRRWWRPETQRTPSLMDGRPSALIAEVELTPGESQADHLRAWISRESREREVRSAGFADHQQKAGKGEAGEIFAAEVVDAAFNALREYWDGLLGIFQVETPDLHTNRMVNIWNAYQCMATFNMSRSASFYESGIGRGLGFRDSNQDLLGFVHMVPSRARERILDLASTQLPSGGAYHQYQPLTKRGNNDVGSNFNDDPHWLIIGVAAYIKETGDWSILDEPVPYDNRGRIRKAALRAPAAQLPVHARSPRAAWAAADWPRRLERLPQSELLLRHAGADLPDDYEQRRQDGRVGLYRGLVCALRSGTGGDCEAPWQ